MVDIATNVIDLRARLAEAKAIAIATGAAEAIAELQSLRLALRKLALVIQFQQLSGRPLENHEKIQQLLDDLAAELSQCMQGLGLTHD